MPVTLYELISLIVSWSRSSARRISGRSFEEIFVVMSALKSAKSSSSVLGARSFIFSSSVISAGSFFAASPMRMSSCSRAVFLLKIKVASASVIFSGYSTKTGSAYKSSRVIFVAIGNSSFE